MKTNTNTHNIVISFDNGRPYVDWPDLVVKPNDKIEWKSFDGNPFILFFRDETPFIKTEKEKLISAKKGSVVSKTVAKSGEKVRTYKYFVIFHDEMLDPIIIVDN